MKLTVKENRELIMVNPKNTQNENEIETFHITVPEKYEDFNKKIVFITDDGVKWDLIENDTYILQRNLTKYDSVNFYIWLTKDEQDFRSVEKTLRFNPNHEVDGEITPEEQTDMERVISILDSEIIKVNNKEQELNTLIDTIQTKLDNGEFNGRDGVDGKDGQDGEKGDKGDKGDKGEKGDKGDKGDRGEQGIQGIQGAKGEKGEKGDTGANGLNGKDGKDGTNGQDGYTPQRGTDYWTNADIASIEQYCANYIDTNITQVLGGSF
jgi:hypothetical protein